MCLIQKLLKQYQYIVMLLTTIINKIRQDLTRVLLTFLPNKSFGQLLDISPTNFIFLKTFDSEFSYIEVWFTDQNSKLLEIVNQIKIA